MDILSSFAAVPCSFCGGVYSKVWEGERVQVRNEGNGVVGFGLRFDLWKLLSCRGLRIECKVTVKHESKDRDVSQSWLIRIV